MPRFSSIQMAIATWSFVTLSTIGDVLTQPVNPAIAKDYTLGVFDPKLEQIARLSTVRIFSQTPGSGVIIQREGDLYTVLTCKHVVETDDLYEVTTTDGQNYPIENQTIHRDPQYDLAVFQFRSSQNYPIIKLGNSQNIQAGKPGYVSGFPLVNLNSLDSSYRFAPGHISANAQNALPGGYSMVYPNDTFRGMSGGPLLNHAGELIGIHGQTLTTQIATGGIDEQSGLKLGFSLAIPIQTFYATATHLTAELPLSRPISNRQATSSPQSADDFYLRAVEKYIYSKDLSTAQSLIQKALQLNPLYGDAYRMRGFLALSALPGLASQQRSQSFQQALADFDQAIRLNPIDVEALNIRGFFRFSQQNYQGAIQDLSTAIALRPDLHVAYHYRGNAYSALGNETAALQDYNQAIRLFPNFVEAYNSRGSTRAEQQDLKGALEDFSIAIRLNPNYSNAYYNRAQVRDRLGDSQGARV